MSAIEERLREMGLTLPRLPKAIGGFIYGVEVPGLLLSRVNMGRCRR